MNVTLLGCAVCGPGLPDWQVAAAVLRGETGWDPSLVREAAPIILPPNERRRLPATARIALGTGLEALQAAGVDARSTATVFACCGSDGAITHQICESLAQDAPTISPTRFHNSVHNAPAGYWSIALGSHAPSTSVCAYTGSFAAGLCEAAAQAIVERRTVLLVAYDLPYPPPLGSLWNVTAPVAAALVIGPENVGRSGPKLGIEVVDDPPSAWDASAPSDLSSHPAAAALQVLALIARNECERTVLPYHTHTSLAVTCTP